MSKKSKKLQAISYVLEKRLFDGTSDTTFSPNKTITRAAFAAALKKLSGDDSDHAEIANGSDDLTREEMAVLLYNYADSIGLTINPSTEAVFSDASDISTDAKAAIQAVTSLGLMSANTDGSFHPDGTTTRADAAEVIYRLSTLINKANTSDAFLSKLAENTASLEQYTTYKEDVYQTITLKGTSISYRGAGAAVNGDTITITEAGTYVISGTLNDGQIIVDSGDDENVRLVLNNAVITCSAGSPILVKNANTTTISLPIGTKNILTDGTNASSKEASGTIFSADDLLINGSGTLTVNANNKAGIAGKDDISITGSKLIINSVKDGITANDSISASASDITITAAGDGIRTTKGDKIEKGYISLKSGNYHIAAGADGIQAETLLYIEGGNYTISTSEINSDSAKALKGISGVVIQGGTFDIDSTDDALHSNGIIRIEDGTFDINSGDDGLHADSSLSIEGGTINIVNAYEGIESKAIKISGGTIDLISSDDGINASGGAGGSNSLSISGGSTEINANGDGIDINGSGHITGGTVLVSASASSSNASLDYDGVFEVSGGTLLFAGSSGMAQAPSSGSTQYTIANSTGTQTAKTMVKLIDSSGNITAAFTPEKEYGHIMISSPDIKEGSAYTLYAGDTKIETFVITAPVSGDTTSNAGISSNDGALPMVGQGSGEALPNHQ